VNGNAIKKKSLPTNYHIQYRSIPVLLLLALAMLVSSSFYLLPLAYSQQLSFIRILREYGPPEASLNGPEGIAVDPSSGNIYVADTANHRIQVFSSNGTFITKWGEYTVGEVRPPSGMRFPEGIAVDQEGNVYVADTANNRILGFTSYAPRTDVTFSSEEGEVYGIGTSLKIETVYEGLSSPTAIAFLGPDDMLVLQRSNTTIMRIVNGHMLDEPVLDLKNTIKLMSDSCMCDIAILQNGNGTTYAFLYYFLAEVTQDDGTKKLLTVFIGTM
jgi:NHL repeat-containing protein